MTKNYKIFVVKVWTEEIEYFEDELEGLASVIEYGIGTDKMFDDSTAPSEQ